MNCRIFQMQVADWLAGRLPEQMSDQMAAHKAACATCASLADREAEMRRLLSDWRTPSTSVDMWPRIAARIDERSTERGLSLGRLFAFGDVRMRSLATAACALAVLVPVVFVLNLSSRTNTMTTQHSTTPSSDRTVRTQSTTVTPPAETPTFDASFAVDPQGDPSIDDPIGGAMEHVWTHVSTYSKDAGH